MKNISTGIIIHLFALLHAAVALLCRLAGVEDELLLTILTMTMTLIICLKKGLNIEELLEKVLLEAELLELKANPHKKATD